MYFLVKIQRCLADLTQSQMAVISRILLGTKSVDFVDAMARQPVERISELAEDLHVKGFHLELQLAHQQRQQGDLDGAAQAVKKVLANSSSYVEIQFNGTLQMGELEGYQLMKSTEPQSQRRGQEARNSAQTLQNRKTAAPIPSSLCADYAEGRRVGSGGSENDRIADDLARTQDARRSLMVGGPFIPASGEPSC